MQVKARHETGEWIYGTFDSFELSDDKIVFCLLLDNAKFGGIGAPILPDNLWFTIEQTTLSDVCAEMTRLGLSDLQPT